MTFYPVTCNTHIWSLVNLIFIGYSCIGAHADKVYIDWHRNFGVGGKYETLFHPTNDFERFVSTNSSLQGSDKFKTPKIQDMEFMSGLQALKDIVDKAATDGRRLRPYGSRWSFNNLPYTNEYMIETSGLNYAKIGIDAVTSDYQDVDKELFTFVQSGVMLKYLYQFLFAKGLTLSTSPTTDGQTIAGSISTGSHNAAIVYGSMEEMVKGIHLVLPNQRTVFVQKQSDDVVTEAYLDEIGADELINDDELFNAALVSCGTFGVIHGFLIQTEKLFTLEPQVRKFPFSQAKEALYSLDIASLGFDLDNSQELPWHFEFFLNPYHLEQKDGCIVRLMQKSPLPDMKLDEIKASAATYTPTYYGQDLMVVMGNVVNQRLLALVEMFGYDDFIGASIRRLIFGIISQLATIALMIPGGLKDGEAKYPLELYGVFNSNLYYDTNPLNSISMELSFPLSQLEEILTLTLQVLYKYPTPTTVNVRYVKSSSTIPLALAKYENEISVFIDLPSIDTFETKMTYRKIQQVLENRRNTTGLIFTYHWGKFNPANDDWIEKAYGQQVLNDWKNERADFLETAETLRLFSNDFTDLIGLTT